MLFFIFYWIPLLCASGSGGPCSTSRDDTYTAGCTTKIMGSNTSAFYQHSNICHRCVTYSSKRLASATLARREIAGRGGSGVAA